MMTSSGAKLQWFKKIIISKASILKTKKDLRIIYSHHIIPVYSYNGNASNHCNIHVGAPFEGVLFDAKCRR